jgi:dihydroxyacid dehydratase/phosphogluconate dehydratase
MVHEDLRPSRILTRQAFENAIVAASALGASTNCPPHVNAIARHAGVPLEVRDWDRIGYEILQRYFLLRRDAPPASAEDYVNSRMQAQVSMQQ